VLILLIKDMLSITLTIEHNLVLKDRHIFDMSMSIFKVCLSLKTRLTYL
jgi:hypothetical protein